MKLYDFDKTVYHGDCTVNFWKHCIRRKPHLLFGTYKPVLGFIEYKLGLKKKEYFKEKFFFFVRAFKDIDAEVRAFWEKEEKNVCRWFKDKVRSDDVIVSASPEFLVRPIAETYGVKCIASEVDKKSGKFLSPNCKGENKVTRLAEIGVTEAEEAYSDSESDMPMLCLAQRGYIIKNISTEEMKIVKQTDRTEEKQ